MSEILSEISDFTTCLEAQLPGILVHRPVMLAYLFGSVADGTASSFSDVDIALVLDPGCRLSAYDRMKMEFDIAAEIEKKCGIREADVRSIDSAPITVKGTVLTEGRLLTAGMKSSGWNTRRTTGRCTSISSRLPKGCGSLFSGN